ncbi:MAG: FAD/NAD(P)-binding protein [Pseudomonadota bacterium]
MAEHSFDYVIIGSGATGLSFADVLLTHSDASIALVDRRSDPGGHWVDGYPFLRLHQPSAYYGVESTPLGRNHITEQGPDAGLYERASVHELRGYYANLVTDRFLPSGRVQFYGSSEYLGEEDDAHVIRSCWNGTLKRLRARRAFVDATYMQSIVPATHTPSFSVAEGVRLVTPTTLVNNSDGADGFTVIGAGKTAADVCGWLLEQGVDPESIVWVRPRDCWFSNRIGAQPLARVDEMARSQANFMEAAAKAEDGPDLALRLEASGNYVRLDDQVRPELFRGAMLSLHELEALRGVPRVVRRGYVEAIDRHRIQFEDGDEPSTPQRVHVDCTARGLASSPQVPVYADGRVTIQPATPGVAPWSAAVLAWVEAHVDDTVEKNRLCPSLRRSGRQADQPGELLAAFSAEMGRRAEPSFRAWAATCRLNPGRGLNERLKRADLADVAGRMAEYGPKAMKNLARIAKS